MSNDLIDLSRDCEATLVPSGMKVTLQKGNKVMITQSLGGSYTVIINGNMAKIDGKDADAIGKEPMVLKKVENHTGPVDDKAIWDQMRTCYDPEIPINIVELGLVYDCQVKPLEAGGNRVDIKMTLTAPGCGMGASIAADVENKVKTVPGVTEAKVELVWDPPWNQSMMSEAAKLQTGLM
jgi:probable FeS assembly SUF system protein SufT